MHKDSLDFGRQFRYYLSKRGLTVAALPQPMILLEEIADEKWPFKDFMRRFSKVYDALPFIPLQDGNKKALKNCYAKFGRLSFEEATKAAAKKLKF